MATHHLAILEYIQSKGAEMDPRVACIHGRILTAYCKKHNVAVTKYVPTVKVWGAVNAYPVAVLDDYFTAERLAVAPLTAKAKNEMAEEAERLEAIRILDQVTPAEGPVRLQVPAGVED